MGRLILITKLNLFRFGILRAVLYEMFSSGSSTSRAEAGRYALFLSSTIDFFSLPLTPYHHAPFLLGDLIFSLMFLCLIVPFNMLSFFEEWSCAAPVHDIPLSGGRFLSCWATSLTNSFKSFLSNYSFSSHRTVSSILDFEYCGFSL